MSCVLPTTNCFLFLDQLDPDINPVVKEIRHQSLYTEPFASASMMTALGTSEQGQCVDLHPRTRESAPSNVNSVPTDSVPGLGRKGICRQWKNESLGLALVPCPRRGVEKQLLGHMCQEMKWCADVTPFGCDCLHRASRVGRVGARNWALLEE